MVNNIQYGQPPHINFIGDLQEFSADELMHYDNDSTASDIQPPAHLDRVLLNRPIPIRIPKQEYIDFLLRLATKSLIKDDPTLITMINSQVEELVNQECKNLTYKQLESYKWIQKILTDGKVSQLVVTILQRIHRVAPPSRSLPLATEHQQGNFSGIGVALNTIFQRVDNFLFNRNSLGFGKDAWTAYFGDIGYEPPLPADIDQILQSPCPFWPQKTVKETHVLMLIPETINGLPLTLRSMEALMHDPLRGNRTKCHRFDLEEYTDPPTPFSHWVLMTRDVIPDSRGRSQGSQRQLVKEKTGYEVPAVLDATVTVFMEYVVTGTRLYSKSPWTYTRCQESGNECQPLVVGAFDINGLDVTCEWPLSDYDGQGQGAMRMLGKYEPPVLK